MGITTGDDNKYIAFEKSTILNEHNKQHLKIVDYRLFDKRYIYCEPTLLARARFQFMKNFFNSNIAISFVRRSRKEAFVLPCITKEIVDKWLLSTLDNANIFPLYLYPPTNAQQTLGQTAQRTPTLTPKLNSKSLLN